MFSELFWARGANALKKILYEMCVPFIFHLAYSDFILFFHLISFFHLIIFCSGFFQCVLRSLSHHFVQWEKDLTTALKQTWWSISAFVFPILAWTDTRERLADSLYTLAFDHFYMHVFLTTLFTQLLPQKADRQRQRVKNSLRQKKETQGGLRS